uniref:Uncharacterized protein n=1 Tax=Aliivibrio wodanis TaxID=80852 RepID=A0A5Q4ZI68_9GAMM|nr:hypothetical protein AW0309160_01423 [Aliivibrio wodanis]
MFLYKTDGSILFVVVKKEDEYLSDAELICLSNIKSVLECDVEVAYLAEERKQASDEMDVFVYVKNILMFEEYYRYVLGVKGDFLNDSEWGFKKSN